MEGESTSCRQLNIEANEDCRDDNVEVIDKGLINEKELENTKAPMVEDYVPRIGQEFEREEDAYQFYLAYAKRVGFSIRKSRCHFNKSGELVDRVLCCSAQGKREKDRRDFLVKNKRPETRFGCEAKMMISRRTHDKLCVIQFVSEHNHYLTSPNETHFLRSHRKISSSGAIQIEMASEVGKASHDLMAKQVGGREPGDCKNYLHSKRTRKMMVGDTGCVLEYLQNQQLKDPHFFSSIQIDEDDLITNIFWADAKMRADYGHFGDVICFDTTYRNNNEGRPVALFVGVNHHKQTVIFGIALLYDETSMSFEWLFDTFSRAMSGKKPTTILTDEDAAMTNALVLRWPETHHRLCIWHIYQNAVIHLSGVFSEFKEFAKSFASCIYDFDEEEDFIAAWNQMLTQYSLEKNDWLRRMFLIKEKWALVYGRHIFCADITTTQRNESMNTIVKRYVTYKHKFLDFFNHFEKLLEDRRYEELKTETRSKLSAPFLEFPILILKQASSIYTPEAYKCFQIEWCKSHDTNVRTIEIDRTLTKYEVTPLRKSYHHIVTVDSSFEKLDCHCDCRKFEFAGILCSHILKVFNMRNILEMPSKFIRKRWTREAKVGYFGVNNSSCDQASMPTKVIQSMRYQELCGLYVQLVTKAAERDDTYKAVKDDILCMLKLVDEKLQVGESDGSERASKKVKRSSKTKQTSILEKGMEDHYETNPSIRDTYETQSSKFLSTQHSMGMEDHYETNPNIRDIFETPSSKFLSTQHSQSVCMSSTQQFLAGGSQPSMR